MFASLHYHQREIVCKIIVYPSERSELRYRVQGVAIPVGYRLSPLWGLHLEGCKSSDKVKAEGENVLHQVRGGMIHDS